MFAVRKNLCDSIIKCPKPEEAPTISAIITNVHPAPIMSRHASQIPGSELGRITLKIVFILFAPNARPASINSKGVFIAASAIRSARYGAMPITSMAIFCESPMPNQIIASGMNADGGMYRTNAITGFTNASNILETPSRMPMGREIARDTRNPSRILETLADASAIKPPLTKSETAADTTDVGVGRKNGLIKPV